MFYSNRSAAHLSLDDAVHALDDAASCIAAKPDWAKGYSRKGAALHALRRYDEAVAAYQEGLKCDADNAACRSGLDEVEKAQAQAADAAARGQSFNPLANAFGPDLFGKMATNPRLSPLLGDAAFVQTLQAIQRDPSTMSEHLKDPRVLTVLGELMGLNVNMGGSGEAMDEDMSAAGAAPPTAAGESQTAADSDPSPMEDDLTDEEKTERARKRAAEDAKQRGNALYKQKQFSEAIACYQEAIDNDANNMSYYSNLAAVKLEMGQYDACIEDCKYVARGMRCNAAIVVVADAKRIVLLCCCC